MKGNATAVAKGHRSPTCRYKNKPREEWAVNKSQQSHVQSNEAVSTTTASQSSSTDQSPNTEVPRATSGWAGAHVLYGFVQSDMMQNCILLDNQSSVTVFSNKELVENIHATDDTLKLYTNGGTLTTNLKCNIPEWGEAWFAPNGITNIFSYAEMAKRYRITSDSSVEKAFTVHLPQKKVKFEEIENGLYVFIPNKFKIPEKMPEKFKNVQFLSSVKENKKFVTLNQFERAKKAQELYHAIGTPSVQDLKAVLRMNLISNNPVTTEDIEMAERIFGPDIGSLKGKTVRRKPAQVVNDNIEVPRELIASQYAITLCVDIVYVNGLQFLTTISKNLKYRTAQYIPSRSSKDYIKVIREVIAVYQKGGFRVTQLYCDNEFCPLMSQMMELEPDININYSSPNEHVPDIERSICVIKERVRATYHGLDFQKLPKVMIKMLVAESAKKLNFFPAKNGVSPFYSPRMIIHGKTLDYAKHCKYAFGTYVQAHDDPRPKNSNLSRTLD